MASNQEGGLCLGIDLGTTSVKVSLVDVKTQCPVFSTSEPTKADISSSAGTVGSEQSPRKILKCVCDCLTRITDKNRALVRCIGISGQMHGVMMWNWESHIDLGADSVIDTSSLITWEDKRANDAFIRNLPAPDSHQHLASGFGCVTLFWLAKFEPELIVKYNVVGSVMDYLVTILCGLDRPVMSHQIAASWGYFNTETHSWNSDLLKEAGFPVHLLPMVTPTGSKVGELCDSFFGIPKGTPVLAAMGDLQCSFKSAVQSLTDAVMNVSTSSQLCYAIRCSGFVPPRSITPTAISYFPYINDTFLAVAASLNGGNILRSFVKMLLNWLGEFDVNVHEDLIWEKLTRLAGHLDETKANGLVAIPLINGERHAPMLTGSLSGITRDNMELCSIFRSLLEGIINNLHGMIPSCQLIESGISRLVINGSVLNRQPYILEFIKSLYSFMEVIEGSDTDAAQGAAKFAAEFLSNL